MSSPQPRPRQSLEPEARAAHGGPRRGGLIRTVLIGLLPLTLGPLLFLALLLFRQVQTDLTA
ncbi:MAG: hypothetical protein JNK29_08730, partial [Anaerolineales bacterium]|nr:hypothetical protein [Anaerolineales bacterium]